MKQYIGLWEKQNVSEQQLNAIRRDWSEGKVPELPYMVVGQENIKKHIEDKLAKIDGSRMETTVIQAQYGDGKTNILKYLELYLKTHEDLNIRMLYCRADPEQIDLCLFLMRHLEASCLKELTKHIMKIRDLEDFDVAQLANNYNDDFALIREYVTKLFEKGQEEEDVNNLIYLGTGRLYSKGMFNKYGLQKMTDFNRREVFVLFMNILASSGLYILFAVDELEKISDKSVKRMAHYFTSYRELLDLFNKINGHYLISAITNGVDIASACQPLYERLDSDIIKIEKIKTDVELTALIDLMASLLTITITDDKKSHIISKLKRNAQLTNNRKTIQVAAELLKDIDYKEVKTIEEELDANESLKALYKQAETKLESESAFNNLSRILFDPLKYYLEALGYKNVDDNLLRRDYQAFIDPSIGKAYFFLFNDDSKIKGRIKEFMEDRDMYNFVVFAPEEMSLSYADLQFEKINIEIVVYNPKTLFILLNMYRWNFDKQPEISRLLSISTKSVFE